MGTQRKQKSIGISGVSSRVGWRWSPTLHSQHHRNKVFPYRIPSSALTMPGFYVQPRTCPYLWEKSWVDQRALSLLNTVACPSASSCWNRQPTSRSQESIGFLCFQVQTVCAALTTLAVLVYAHIIRRDKMDWSNPPESRFLRSLVIMHLWCDLKLHKFSNCLSIDVKDFCFRFKNAAIDHIEVTWQLQYLPQKIFHNQSLKTVTKHWHKCAWGSSSSWLTVW